MFGYDEVAGHPHILENFFSVCLSSCLLIFTINNTKGNFQDTIFQGTVRASRFQVCSATKESIGRASTLPHQEWFVNAASRSPHSRSCLQNQNVYFSMSYIRNRWQSISSSICTARIVR